MGESSKSENLREEFTRWGGGTGRGDGAGSPAHHPASAGENAACANGQRPGVGCGAGWLSRRWRNWFREAASSDGYFGRDDPPRAAPSVDFEI